MENRRRELVSWEEVDRLIEHLLTQFDTEFSAMVMITRGGIVPGGMLGESMDIKHILTAAVDFPAQVELESSLPRGQDLSQLMVWPKFLQFPDEELLRGRRTLVIDDVWGLAGRLRR
ncbi:MAG: hypothetical protein HC806_02105 [Anaerolineae bacterium]|nr:hypothetical protein [Anaerolineae bacterium]